MTEVRVLDRPPALAPLYARAVLPRRPAGRLPDSELVLPEVPVRRAALARYARVCGLPAGGPVPPAYPHVLAFGLALRLMTDPAFPVPALGLVHVRNEITALRPLHPDERPTLRVRAERLVTDARGAALDLVTV